MTIARAWPGTKIYMESMRRIVKVLNKSNKPMTRWTIKTKAEVGWRATLKILAYLKREGLVRKVMIGGYVFYMKPDADVDVVDEMGGHDPGV